MKKITGLIIMLACALPTIGSAAVANKHPVISSVLGPKTLSVGKVGGYVVKTWEPNGEMYTLGANWGDGTFSTTTIQGTSTEIVKTTQLSKGYQSPGRYQIKFEVVDKMGKKAWTWMETLVNATTTTSTRVLANRHPIISNFSGPDKTMKGKVVNYQLQTREPNAERYSYQISWGDGGYSTGTIFATSTNAILNKIPYTYKNTGTYESSVKVWDQKSASAETGMVVTVVSGNPTTTPTSTPTSTSLGASILEILEEQVDGLFGIVADLMDRLAERNSE